MNYTIRDVAKKANVSIATVSRVLNEKDRVKKETREKVLAAAKELNYVTNFAAKTLRQNRTNMIGVIVPNVATSFYGEIVKGIEKKALEFDLRVILCDSEYQEDREKDFIKFLYNHSVDGMIFILPRIANEEFVKIREKRNNLVVFGRNMEQYNISSITVDNILGAQIAVRHLFSRGYRKIAFLSGISETYFCDRLERMEGFKQAIAECGLELRPEYIEKVDEERVNKAFLRLMNLPEPPDAIFCGYDELALEVLKSAQKEGITIPDQVALMGFDDIRVCQYTSPRLTTVKQPTYTIGRLCCEKLLTILNGKEEEANRNKNLLLRPELVIRDSC